MGGDHAIQGMRGEDEDVEDGGTDTLADRQTDIHGCLDSVNTHTTQQGCRHDDYGEPTH